MNLFIEAYKTRSGKWTWRMKSRNGKIVGNAADSYDRPSGARGAALKLSAALGSVPVWIMSDDGKSLMLAQKRAYNRRE